MSNKLAFYKAFNETHVPDIIRPEGSTVGRDEVYEIKTPSPLTKTYAAFGHRFAMADNEERALAAIFGRPASGRHGDCAFDPLTGGGHVSFMAGQYRDAAAKRISVVPVVVEALGAIGTHGLKLLTRLAKMAEEGRDGTLYHPSCPCFFPHHARRVSRAVVFADARAIHSGISRVKFRMSMGSAAAPM